MEFLTFIFTIIGALATCGRLWFAWKHHDDNQKPPSVPKFDGL